MTGLELAYVVLIAIGTVFFLLALLTIIVCILHRAAHEETGEQKVRWERHYIEPEPRLMFRWAKGWQRGGLNYVKRWVPVERFDG